MNKFFISSDYHGRFSPLSQLLGLFDPQCVLVVRLCLCCRIDLEFLVYALMHLCTYVQGGIPVIDLFGTEFNIFSVVHVGCAILSVINMEQCTWMLFTIHCNNNTRQKSIENGVQWTSIHLIFTADVVEPLLKTTLPKCFNPKMYFQTLECVCV